MSMNKYYEAHRKTIEDLTSPHFDENFKNSLKKWSFNKAIFEAVMAQNKKEQVQNFFLTEIETLLSSLSMEQVISIMKTNGFSFKFNEKIQAVSIDLMNNNDNDVLVILEFLDALESA